MRKIDMQMGTYYTNVAQDSLVRTICRASLNGGKEPIIVYAYVNDGGVVSEAYYMPENEFVATYIL